MKQLLNWGSRRRNNSLALAIFLSFAIFIFSASVARGLELEYYGVETTISEDMTTKNVINIRFAQPEENFDYGLDYKIYNLSTTSTFDSAQCSIFEGKSTSRIVCKLNGITKDKNLLTLTFYRTGGITTVLNRNNFSANYDIPASIKESFILIKIPQNSVLSEELANQSYSPSDGKTLTDGKHIMVYWQKENLTADDELRFSVSYAVPVEGGIYNNLLVVFVSGIVIISMISVAIYVRRGSYGEKSTTELLASVLNTDEKKVIDILSRHGGKSGQKIIVRESDFSKAKVSRLVKNLKARGVVEIEPISGRENRIILRFEKRPEQVQTEAPNPGLQP